MRYRHQYACGNQGLGLKKDQGEESGLTLTRNCKEEGHSNELI